MKIEGLSKLIFLVLIFLFLNAVNVKATPPSIPEGIEFNTSIISHNSIIIQKPDWCSRFDIKEDLNSSEMEIYISLYSLKDETGIELVREPLIELYRPYTVRKSWPDGRIVSDVHGGRYFNPFNKSFECGEVKKGFGVISGETGEQIANDTQECFLGSYILPCGEAKKELNYLGYNTMPLPDIKNVSKELDGSKIKIYLGGDLIMESSLKYRPGTTYPGSNLKSTNIIIFLIPIFIIVLVFLVVFVIVKIKKK